MLLCHSEVTKLWICGHGVDMWYDVESMRKSWGSMKICGSEPYFCTLVLPQNWMYVFFDIANRLWYDGSSISFQCKNHMNSWGSIRNIHLKSTQSPCLFFYYWTWKVIEWCGICQRSPVLYRAEDLYLRGAKNHISQKPGVWFITR